MDGFHSTILRFREAAFAQRRLLDLRVRWPVLKSLNETRQQALSAFLLEVYRETAWLHLSTKERAQIILRECK